MKKRVSKHIIAMEGLPTELRKTAAYHNARVLDMDDRFLGPESELGQLFERYLREKLESLKDRR